MSPDTHPSSSGKRLSHGPWCRGLPLVKTNMLPGVQSSALLFCKGGDIWACGHQEAPEVGARQRGMGVQGDSRSPQTREASPLLQDWPWPFDTNKVRPR